MTGRPPTSDRYFDETWATGDDPWDHAGRWYERRKYELTAAALPKAHYERSFEPGCGTGVLTRLLAARSSAHVAMERHPRGAQATAARCADLPQVEVSVGTIPEAWPDGTFGLIVLSEVLYYLDETTIACTLDRCRRSLRPDGHVVAVHYRPNVEAHTWNGDEVHRQIRSTRGWTPGTRILDPEFVLDVLTPQP